MIRASQAGVFALALLLAAAGCRTVDPYEPVTGSIRQAPNAPEGLLENASVASVVADWNDVDAAVLVAAEAAEMAVVGSQLESPTRRVIHMRSVSGERVVLVVDREAGDSSGESVPMRLRITSGRFGNPSREEAFLKALVARLKALHGVEYRPL